jgi:hypothetical protein
MSDNAPLTVVLVRDAYADASSWNGVVERLQAAGIQVAAPANPLRGLVSQPDAVADVILTAAAAIDRAPAGMRG